VTAVCPAALLDTCVLYPTYLRDTLLRLAATGLYQPLWSDDILIELNRNLVEVGIAPGAVERTITAMRTHFDDAEVTGYANLTETMTCDPKDRHVLAAAVRGEADALVTFNAKDFPPASLAAYPLNCSSRTTSCSACSKKPQAWSGGPCRTRRLATSVNPRRWPGS
jgi:predicted nucleic acid-binding protein